MKIKIMGTFSFLLISFFNLINATQINIASDIDNFLKYDAMVDSLKELTYIKQEVFVQYYIDGKFRFKLNGKQIGKESSGLGRLKETVYLNNGYNKIEVEAVRSGEPWMSFGLYKVQKIYTNEKWEYSRYRNGPWYNVHVLENGNIWGSEDNVLFFRKKIYFSSNKYIKRHNHIELKTKNNVEFFLNGERIAPNKAFMKKGENILVCRVVSNPSDGFFLEIRYLEQSLKNLIIATDKSWKWNGESFEAKKWKNVYITDFCNTVHGAACIWSKPYSRNVQYFKKEFLIFSKEASRKSFLSNQTKLKYANVKRSYYLSKIKNWLQNNNTFDLMHFVIDRKNTVKNKLSFVHYQLPKKEYKASCDTFYYSTKKDADFLVDLSHGEKIGKDIDNLAKKKLKEGNEKGKDMFIGGSANAATTAETTPDTSANGQISDEAENEIDEEKNDIIYLQHLQDRLSTLDKLYAQLKKNKDPKIRKKFEEIINHLEIELEQLKKEGECN